jgi:hypothetical protein
MTSMTFGATNIAAGIPPPWAPRTSVASGDAPDVGSVVVEV